MPLTVNCRFWDLICRGRLCEVIKSSVSAIHGNNSEIVLSPTISETLKSPDILRRVNTTKWNHVFSLSTVWYRLRKNKTKLLKKTKSVFIFPEATRWKKIQILFHSVSPDSATYYIPYHHPQALHWSNVMFILCDILKLKAPYGSSILKM